MRFKSSTGDSKVQLSLRTAGLYDIWYEDVGEKL